MRLELPYLPPSLKNRKRVSGKRLTTDPEVQHIMAQITDAFVLQIYTEFQRQKAAAEIATTCTLRAWMPYNVPLNDSVRWIPDARQLVEFVSKEKESTTLIIERIK